MSAFGKRGVRCDGCGMISNRQDGEYVIGNRVGYINCQGHNSNEDLCERCDAKSGVSKHPMPPRDATQGNLVDG